MTGKRTTHNSSQRTTREGGIRIGDRASVTVGGDLVGRDKVENTRGDRIETGQIIDSSGVAIGRGASAKAIAVQGEDELAVLFKEVYQLIEARPEESDVEKSELEDTVKRIEDEAAKGEEANPTKVKRWLGLLAEMAPDIFEVTLATLANPVAGVAMTPQQVAAKAREESAQI